MSDETITGGIAIVGMAGRFPGAQSVDQFWKNVQNGVESVTHFSPDQLELGLPAEEDGHYVCAKGMLEGVEDFDASFFGYMPKEASLMDPQHRLFLEICSEAMEQSGHDPSRYEGDVGVFAGCYMDTYLLHNLCSDEAFRANLVEQMQVGTLQTELGNDKDYLATRVAFKMGLTGPAMTLQTACSTSLVAIATACQSLETFGCDMALAGGVTLVLPQYKGYFYKEGSMLSPDGHCRTFDENAAGTVFSNGAAVVLLKRVEDALRDGDTIHAVIRGYATNNDGATKVSYTAPSIEGQANVIAQALAVADIDAGTVGYVEAHGTATPVGDPIEIAGLSQAFAETSDKKGHCAIGSVKANLGHLDVASGAIGLIKAALSIRDGILPPQINFSAPNSAISFEDSPFYVNTTKSEWGENGHPRRAGVSSFGVGGTNAHIVLEQAPSLNSVPLISSPPAQLVPVSAKSDAALSDQFDQLADYLEKIVGDELDAVVGTLQEGRTAHPLRQFAVIENATSASEVLRQRQTETPINVSDGRPNVIFLFTGQGSQYPGMAAGLYTQNDVFRTVIDEAISTFDAPGQELGNLKSLLVDPVAVQSDGAAEILAQTQLTQPALVAFEVAFSKMLMSWGLTPDALVGHSVGEISAMVIAGSLSLRDGMKFASTRGELMQAQPPGRMLAIMADIEDVRGVLGADDVISAVNAPGLIVVSGSEASIATLASRLSEKDIPATVLKTSHGFHSPLISGARGPLENAVSSFNFGEASLPIFSTATGELASKGEMQHPTYWGKQLVNPVLFQDAMAAAFDHYPGAILLEVGPGRTLSRLGQRCDEAQTAAIFLAGHPGPEDDADPFSIALHAAGQCWARGRPLDWSAIRGTPLRRVPLPTYPFQRKRHWVEPKLTQMTTTASESGDAPPPDHPQQTDSLQRLLHEQLAVVQHQLDVLKTRRS